MMEPNGLDKLVALFILIEALHLSLAAGLPENRKAGKNRGKPHQAKGWSG